jgi:hypothetical protein
MIKFKFIRSNVLINNGTKHYKDKCLSDQHSLIIKPNTAGVTLINDNNQMAGNVILL